MHNRLKTFVLAPKMTIVSKDKKNVSKALMTVSGEETDATKGKVFIIILKIKHLLKRVSTQIETES